VEVRECRFIYLERHISLNWGKCTRQDSLFRFAKDLDALRFRAPEKINEIIKRLAEKLIVGLINVDSILMQTSPDGIVGNNLTVDHLHPSLSGYLLMGKIYLKQLKEMVSCLLIKRLQITDNQQDSIVTHNFAFSRLDTVISNIRLIGLLNDWPFVDKPDLSFIKKLS